MFGHLITNINNDLKRTRKAIISLGCSFVQGQGAIEENIFKNYVWTCGRDGKLGWNLSVEEQERIIKEYPDIEIYHTPNSPISFTNHEYNNSFVNVLTRKYFNGEYTGINLGRAGNGNRATIKDLYFYPDLDWDSMDEIIVIYCPSGAERVDFISDGHHELNKHNRWVTAWPNSIDDNTGVRNKLWTGIKESLNSDKFQVLEQIAHVQELLLWCKYKNAKLIVTPAFSNQYTREWFKGALSQSITRDTIKGIQKIETIDIDPKEMKQTINMWPWENMFYPDNSPTFVDYVMKQEYGTKELAPYFYTLVGKGSPNLWISPCAHPAKKAHDAFAKTLYEHIKEKL